MEQRIQVELKRKKPTWGYLVKSFLLTSESIKTKTTKITWTMPLWIPTKYESARRPVTLRGPRRPSGGPRRYRSFWSCTRTICADASTVVLLSSIAAATVIATFFVRPNLISVMPLSRRSSIKLIDVWFGYLYLSVSSLTRTLLCCRHCFERIERRARTRTTSIGKDAERTEVFVK